MTKIIKVKYHQYQIDSIVWSDYMGHTIGNPSAVTVDIPTTTFDVCGLAGLNRLLEYMFKKLESKYQCHVEYMGEIKYIKTFEGETEIKIESLWDL